MLTDEQKAVLHYAIDNGVDSIETEGYVGNGNWEEIIAVKLREVLEGHIGIRIKQTPDSIDWTHVSTDIYCMARDETRGCYFFTTMPKVEKNADYWYSDGKYYGDVELFASYKRGNVDWKESLVLNPYYKDKK